MEWVWVYAPTEQVVAPLSFGTTTYEVMAEYEGWSWFCLRSSHAASLGAPFRIAQEPPPELAYSDGDGDPGAARVVQLRVPPHLLPPSARGLLEEATRQVVSGQVRVVRDIAGFEAFVQSLGHVAALDKVAPGLRLPASGPVRAAVAEARRMVAVDHRPQDAAAVYDAVLALGVPSGDVAVGPDRVVLPLRFDAIEALAATPEVLAIRPFQFAQAATNRAAIVVGLPGDRLLGSAPVDGAGEVVALVDTGIDRGTTLSGHLHPSLVGRIADIQKLSIPSMWAGKYGPAPEGDPAPADGPLVSPGEAVGHGTHIAGTIVGAPFVLANGRVSEGRGVASAAGLHVFAVGHRVRWLPGAGDGVHAWPPGDYGYFGLGFGVELQGQLDRVVREGGPIVAFPIVFQGDEPPAYDPEARAVDAVAWARRSALFVLPAGNQGRAERRVGTVSSPGTAKNGLTVGATENDHAGLVCAPAGRGVQVIPPWRDRPEAVKAYGYRATGDLRDFADDPDQIAPYSGRGPALGRRKPDVVAPGNGVMATRSLAIAANELLEAVGDDAGLYAWGFGTSCAVGVTSGLAAVIRGHLRNRHHHEPSGSLLKAMLIAAARRPPGGDVDEWGFGRVGGANLMRPDGPVRFKDDVLISSTDIHTWKVTVAGDDPVSVTMVWMDAPGDGIVNHLQLIQTSGDDAPAFGSGGPSGKVTDNAQRLVVQARAGTTIEFMVRATVSIGRPGLPGTQQDYALVVLGASALDGP